MGAEFAPTQGASWIDQRVQQGLRQVAAPRETFSIGELSCPAGTLYVVLEQCPGQQRVRVGCCLLPLSALHRLIKGLQNEMGFLAPAWCIDAEWTVQGAQRSEGLGWWLGTCDYCSPELAPILEEPQERKTVEPSPPLPAGTRNTCKTALEGVKSTGSFLGFFFCF